MAAGSHFAYRSEMARNVIKSDFRLYKIAAAGHFVKKVVESHFVVA